MVEIIDEVSLGIVVISLILNIFCQGLQMFMFSKLQGMLPQGMPAINEIINSQRVPEPQIWQEVNQNQDAEVKTKGH